MKSLHLIICQYRNRRSGKRRTFEICELLKDETDTPTLNTLFKWDPREDVINKMYPSIRVKNEIGMFTGMNEAEIDEEINNKKLI